MAEKIDIFKVLDQASKKNISYYDNLTDDQKKSVAPFVIQRWLTGTSNAQQVFLINEIVNPFTFALQKHKALLWYLMTICTNGKPQRYFWNKSKSTSSKPETLSIICEYFNYSKKHAHEALPVLVYDDIIEFAHSLGKQADVISKINKEWGVKNGKNNKGEGSTKDENSKSSGTFADIFEE